MLLPPVLLLLLSVSSTCVRTYALYLVPVLYLWLHAQLIITASSLARSSVAGRPPISAGLRVGRMMSSFVVAPPTRAAFPLAGVAGLLLLLLPTTHCVVATYFCLQCPAGGPRDGVDAESPYS